MPDSTWPALREARRCDGPPRIPFVLAQAPRIVLGSVARDRLPVLRTWPDAFEERGGALQLRLPPDARDARLAAIHAALRDRGLIPAWRDEPFPLRDRAGGEHGRIERAACRFWGSLTLGAHCNGYLADAAGRPTHLWIARRADHKPTDPGRLDNLVGGGVPCGQSPFEALVREAWEEAGLTPPQLQGLGAHEVLEVECDIPEGRQHERLQVFDLLLPPGLEPRAVDGEVAWHRCMPLDEALARAARGELTTDAALVTFAFARRHDLFDHCPAARPSAAQLASFETLCRPAPAPAPCVQSD